ncbi:hypothetical protein BSL78_30131 [Apostichopus japonicus]|uniref:Transmembrane protein n=1 Tax=Stichopus japonicus TaxID=307972 RepID=A0A2G8JBD7_STIJA|nr:hypothetical protein BSL78_30131 [Apostichopus japonicus]
MASIEISEYGETTVTSLGYNGASASCSGTSRPSSSGYHLGVQADTHHSVRKTLPSRPVQENGESSRATRVKNSRAHRKNCEENTARKITCSFCSLQKRFHLFSIFRYIFIGVVFTTWLSVTVSICVMAFTYSFYLGLIALLIVFLQLLPVLVICIATYGNCCGICDNRQRSGYRSHVVTRPRQNEEQRAMIANYTVVMPTVVVSQATDSPSVTAKATSC